MNPRQRRGAMMMGLAAVGAVGVFFSVLSYVNDVETQVGDKVEALVVTQDVAQYQPIPADAVETIEVPARWLPDTAMRTTAELSGTVAAAPLESGTLLQSSTVIPAPSITGGTRAVTILVDAEAGVAGKITPGATVDVWAAFAGDTTGTGSPRTKIVAQRVQVIDVGVQTQRNRALANGVVAPTDAIPITFAANTDEIKALTFAESFATEVRLALRAPADESLVSPDQRTYAETFQIPGAD
ncbi:Flp pilus assembly protein CpaB [Nocardioides sp.]|uniref:Flp pilus assembly protein CpaB n=1 Tax=Nocardioides sp. TaxID=35761 RepID=UPI0039E6B1A5